MKKIILVLFFLLPLASALEFSPANLEFSLSPNEIACKEIYFKIESPTKIHSSWAQEPSAEWSITGFKTNPQEHGISLSYPSQLSPEQKELPLCISGSNSGEYKGALIFRQEKVGNSIVQFAVWLKLTIKEVPSQEDDDSSSTSKKSHKSDSSSSSGISEQISNNPPAAEPLAYNPPTVPEEIKLKNPSTKESNKTIRMLAIIPTVLIAIFLIILLVLKRPSK